MPADVKHAFPDSNILLHFPALDGLDWCGMCDAQSVVIHITQPVVRELNKVKDAGYSKSVRKRAASVQRRLRSILRENGLMARLGEGVTLQLESRTPTTASFKGLDPSVSDDLLIAAVLNFSQEHSVNGLLVTDDSGLGLLIKAADWKITAIEPPADLRFPAEPDEDQKEQQNLRQKLAALEHALPNLSLSFANGEQHARIDPLTSDIEAEVKQRCSKVRKDHPLLPLPEPPSTQSKRMTIGEVIKAEGSHVPWLDRKTLERHNKELNEYYKTGERVIRENATTRARTIRIAIQVENSGAAPANDVLVDMHFPNGMKVLEKKKAGDILKQMPEPPRNPTTFILPKFGVDTLGYHALSNIRPVSSNEPSLSIRETNSYEVRWRVPKLRQGYTSDVDPIFVLFDVKPFSFEVSFSIVADNCPSTTKGSLHVVLEELVGSNP